MLLSPNPSSNLSWMTDYPPFPFLLALWQYKNAWRFCSENNLVLKIKTSNRNSKKTNNSFSWSTKNYAYNPHCSSPSIAEYLIFLYKEQSVLVQPRLHSQKKKKLVYFLQNIEQHILSNHCQ